MSDETDLDVWRQQGNEDPPAIPAEVAQILREWHDRVGFGCVAHGEGQICCLDVLTS